jgi:uracil-DNA glycosylase
VLSDNAIATATRSARAKIISRMKASPSPNSPRHKKESTQPPSSDSANDQRRTTNDAPHWLNILNKEVIACRRCPRLVAYREKVAFEKRRAYLSWDYWGKPVPGFGDPNARVLVMGLAPGAHGSNRTGRPFTGDASGNFMYPVLYETGFANQPAATDRNDGLKLKDLYITAAVRCAPPDNKPLPQELVECSNFLDRELAGLKKVKVVVALGKIGFDAYLNYVKRRGLISSRAEYVFKHAASYRLPDGKMLLASYHPSNQNTQTGKLTRKMFVAIFQEAAKLADE